MVSSLRPLLGASTLFDEMDLLAFEIPSVHSLCSVVGGDTSAVSIDHAVAVTQLGPMVINKMYISLLLFSQFSGPFIR